MFSHGRWDSLQFCNDALFSQNKDARFKYLTFKSFKKPKIYVTSHADDAIALYSTSAEDLDIVFYFLFFKKPVSLYHVNDILDLGHDALLESH